MKICSNLVYCSWLLTGDCVIVLPVTRRAVFTIGSTTRQTTRRTLPSNRASDWNQGSWRYRKWQKTLSVRDTLLSTRQTDSTTIIHLQSLSTLKCLDDCIQIQICYLWSIKLCVDHDYIVVTTSLPRSAFRLLNTTALARAELLSSSQVAYSFQHPLITVQPNLMT